MSAGGRVALFGAAAVAFAALLTRAMGTLPEFGHYPGPYGDLINSAVVEERHITSASSAVNFDYRGFDTLGEEFILFAAVIGVVVLLRATPRDRRIPAREGAADRVVVPPAESVVAVSVLMLALGVTFGIYVVAHGHLSPGGGFQGGAIIASSVALAYLAFDDATFGRFSPPALLEVGKSLGAGAYVVVGFIGVFAGAAFLQNVLPLGTAGELDAGGTTPIINTFVGLEVAAGLVLTMSELLTQLAELRVDART